MAIEFPARWKITSLKAIDYEIVYSPTLFDYGQGSLLDESEGDRRLVFVDSVVLSTYKSMIESYFSQHAPGSIVISIESNEILKTLESSLQLIKHMEDFGILRRSEPVIVIGGGTLLDSVGFACSIYRRGIPYIRIPTTLLGIVDVSVAIKTGVNHLDRRNRLGTYYPPKAVYLYRKFIDTQSEREISNGLGEILKLGIITDISLFILLEENASLLRREKFQYGAVPVQVINRAISNMMNNLQNNLWEDNLLRVVDFGHSFSPLIELKNLPELLHGEAVALDCLYSSCLALSRELITESDVKRIFQVCKNLGLPIFHTDFLDVDLLDSALQDTVKHRNGNQNLPIPIGIGTYQFLNDVGLDDLKRTSNEFLRISEAFCE